MSNNQRQSRLVGQNLGGLLSGVGASIIGGGLPGYPGIETKITMNLEDVSLHEQKLNTILENLRNDTNASLACEDWWDLTETSDLHKLICSKLVRDI